MDQNSPKFYADYLKTQPQSFGRSVLWTKCYCRDARIILEDDRTFTRGGGCGCWGKKMKTEGEGKKMKKKGKEEREKGEKGEKGPKNGLKTHL